MPGDLPANAKKVFSSLDAAPAVMFAKQSVDSEHAFPLVATTFGTLPVTTGMVVPIHNQQIIDETDPNNVTILYKLNGNTVATKTIVKSGSTTTITVT